MPTYDQFQWLIGGNFSFGRFLCLGSTFQLFHAEGNIDMYNFGIWFNKRNFLTKSIKANSNGNYGLWS